MNIVETYKIMLCCLVNRDLSMNKLVGGYNRIKEGLCTGVTCPLMSMYVSGCFTFCCCC